MTEPELLEGRIFTHRLSESEAEFDLLSDGPDLAPVSMLTSDPTFCRLTDGSPIVDVAPGFDTEILADRGVPVTALGTEGGLLLEPGRFAALGVGAGGAEGAGVTLGAALTEGVSHDGRHVPKPQRLRDLERVSSPSEEHADRRGVDRRHFGTVDDHGGDPLVTQHFVASVFEFRRGQQIYVSRDEHRRGVCHADGSERIARH
jgi:hypothetical protein